jgi:general secretion pathway protein G
VHRVSSSSNKRCRGITLIELIVTLVILSILASAALPYAEMTVRRDKELELRRALRSIRTAIDDFHADWQAGRIPKFSDAASEDGYPVTLNVLVEGIDLATAGGKHKLYLRRIPSNPFAGDPSQPAAEQWMLRSYQDTPDATVWGGQDVYDVRVETDKKAIDGSAYRNW